MNELGLLEQVNSHDIVLGSASPRRKELLRGLGIRFRTAETEDMEEYWPPELSRWEIPEYLARHKALHFRHLTGAGTVLITADTIVWHGGQVLGKPGNLKEAAGMLARLSGSMHEVYTGVCLKSEKRERIFHSCTKVFFRTLAETEIDYYIRHFRPMDKAGAYGVQEWIGYIGVERVEGCYYNVMGLPVQRLYEELIRFTGKEEP